MGDDADTAPYGDIGKAVEEVADIALGGDGGGGWQDVTPTDSDGDSSGGAIEQIGRAVGDALDYAHDVADDPPERTGPYPAGGPH